MATADTAASTTPTRTIKPASHPPLLAGERGPMAVSRPGLHETVLQILKPLPRGSMLDCPTGEGALAQDLLLEGFDVRCCDLYSELFRLDGVEIKRGDLSGTLPYSSRSFDYIVSLDGLEHIDSPPQAFREYKRLLKPGGHLVISVPNIMNVEERLKWLLFGYTSHFKPLSEQYRAKISHDCAGMDEIVVHANPIGYNELRYYAEKNGFAIQGVYRDRKKANQWLYWPLVALIRLLGKLTPQARRKDRWTEELTSDEVLLGGNTIIIHFILR
ncbi:MAG TPA: class I SAM-dependent methyltransferase [Candidatus Dormibacteraeota bacterium]|nr:class I SAM-dependent methyltransferase [Candidatus Dormibacteraeota bacterium]